MALDFPANPTNGQTFNQYIYDSSIPGWRNVNSGEGIGLQFKSGLIPVVPTSVTVSSGSASVATDGTVTITGSGDAILNGIFTSAYRNYRILFTSPLTGNTAHGAVLYFRFSTAGVTNSTSQYSFTNWYTQSGGNGNLSGNTNQNWGVLGYFKDFNMDVFQPMDASTGTQVAFNGVYNNTYMVGQAGLNANVAVDGIQFANNYYTGKIKVYAYN